MTVYGYVKTMIHEEVDEAVTNKLVDNGCEYLYVDKVNRVTDKRVEFDNMVNILSKGDIVLLDELTSLFRTSAELKARVKAIADSGAYVKSLTQTWLDTEKNPGIIDVFDGLIEFEKDLLADRIKAGMEVAKSKGVELGRPTANTSKLSHAVDLYMTGDYSVPEICKICDVSKSTLYRELRKQNKVRAPY